MRKINKILSIIKSMKLGVILLVMLGVTSVAGTMIPQNESVQFYAQNYGSKFNNLLQLLELDNVYYSWWYAFIVTLLIINLTTCIITRLPSVVRHMKSVPDGRGALIEKNLLFEVEAEGVIENLSAHMGFKKLKEIDENIYASRKNNIGYMGSWMLHLGILLIIVFFALGNRFAYETNLYGVPGTMGQLENTDLFMKINSFDVKFRDDFTAEQYITNIDIINNKQEVLKSGDVSVNSPLRYNHYSFYQNSMGYAVNLKVYEGEEKIHDDVFYQSEVYVSDGKKFAVQFMNFYPDMEMTGEGPKTITPYFNNPYMLYAVFYEGYMADMNVVPCNSSIIYREFSFTVERPQEFTLINIRKDLFTPFAFLGALILIAGIMVTFYLVPVTLYAVKTKETALFYICSKKNNEMIKIKLLLKYDDFKRGEQSNGLE
ncbi:cytochrome c biogenesis protein ResB [Sedimentibacter sp. B4]|uniref:cytochrome c biogenesis protein ResB n=1 Tax=Sedimentibacter sp. B4 TaxID=304766 RepID=UPI0002F4E682|nr:cytochrome c biogenesis protein ResB [Sedimentibacter sp. B4]